jgi:uncharacterized protein YndB with AHSA1/START domain
MKLLLKILGGLAVLVLLLVAIAFFLPRKYSVERSIVIDARPEVVFAQFADLKAWKNWGAWQERDPAMKMTFSEPATGVGAWSAWESKSQGNGRMTITDVEPAKRMVYRLEFPDMGTSSIGAMSLQPADKGVKVVWSDAGDLGMNPMFRWFGLFIDRMLGPDFEHGLRKMKALAEKAPK